MASTGKVIVFTGPSGVGKGTIERQLFADHNLKLELVISATTRAKRPHETHGVNYYFVSRPEFDDKIAHGEFLEWNEHFGNRYGTPCAEIHRIMAKGHIPFLEVEVNGAANIVKAIGKQRVFSIFVTAPDACEIERRIRMRGAENEKQIAERLARVQEEMQHAGEFNLTVINDNLNETVDKIKTALIEVLDKWDSQ